MPDYIIVGQGICGSFLSYYLTKLGKDILVIDKPQANTASKIASGIINPVTGRRIVKTWLIDELMPFAWQAYNELGNEFGRNLIRQCDVLDFFATPQMRDAFTERSKEEPDLLNLLHDDAKQESLFRFNYGVGNVHPCYLTDVQLLMNLWREKLQLSNQLQEEEFDVAELQVGDEINYKDTKAQKIIFCDGAAGAKNPFFERLPFAFNKGEALLVSIPGLPQDFIYKQGINIVPWKEKNSFWVGSNYVWNYTDLNPTEAFRKVTEEQLKYWLRLPFSMIDHIASERPANVERRPFVGLHPVHQNVGILNGMGTKGSSLAPYFAYQLANHLVTDSPIEPLADVKRFSRVLSR